MDPDQVNRVVERIDKRVAFLGHLTWFVFLNLLFASVNLATTPEYWWSLVVAGGWSIALFVHLIRAFFIADLEGPYRDRILADELERTRGES